MPSTVRRTLVTLAASSLMLTGLAACGSEEEAPEPEGVTEHEPVEVEGTPEDDEVAPGDGEAAPWANPVSTEGELLGSVEAGDVTVDVYLVGEDSSTRDSLWGDPDTEEPFVQEGDDVIVLNYVVTNNGDPITLTSGLVDVSFIYDTWEFYQQPSVSDSAVMENHGVNSNAIAETGEDVYVLGTGESYAEGAVLLYQPGEAFTVEVEVAERDDEGERTGESFEGELTGTIE